MGETTILLLPGDGGSPHQILADRLYASSVGGRVIPVIQTATSYTMGLGVRDSPDSNEIKKGVLEFINKVDDATDYILVGWSMGGGVALELALKMSKIKALLLLAPKPDKIKESYADIKAKTFIIHNEYDKVVKSSKSRDLNSVLPNSSLLIYGGTDNHSVNERIGLGVDFVVETYNQLKLERLAISLSA